VLNEAFRLIHRDIPDIFAYINSTTGGYNPIDAQLVNSPQKDHKILQIIDADVNKKEKLKQICEANKTQKANLTKQDIAGKYRCLPPGLESYLFERNRIKFRPLTMVDPYKRKVFNQNPPD
jgi:hypothetical protein